MALTSNLHDPVIWVCETTGKKYDNDDVETCGRFEDGSYWEWKKHTHLDGTVCVVDWHQVDQ